MTLGSLFDGIGGFPLAASRLGITPVWASEIEKACISITRRHFPHMKHLGDIARINGAEIEPVDIISFGSPCQDLSVAGNRKGLTGERSGLFLQAIRIIREMRNATNGEYPTFIVWENVVGAMSSPSGDKGADFRKVLEEVARITQPGVHVPFPPRRKWKHAGSIVGDGYSIAWRTLDARFWGVPQRRKRIFLVADFRGDRAAEILFKPGSLRRSHSQSGAQGEGAACVAQKGAAVADGVGCLSLFENHGQDSRVTGPHDTCPTVSRKWGTGGNNTPLVVGFDAQQITSPTCRSKVEFGEPQPTLCNGNRQHVITASFMAGQGAKAGSIAYSEETAPTLKAANSGLNQAPSVLCVKTAQTGSNGCGVSDEVSYTLDQTNGQVVVYPETARTLAARYDSSPCVDRGQNVVAFGFKGFGHYTQTDTAKSLLSCDDITTGDLIAGLDCRNGKENGDVCGTLQAHNGGGFSYNCIHPVRIGYAVRRLTPLECERLMGFPDGWTEYGVFGKSVCDSARYRALGNSVAIPCVMYVLEGVREAQIKSEA